MKIQYTIRERKSELFAATLTLIGRPVRLVVRYDK